MEGEPKIRTSEELGTRMDEINVEMWQLVEKLRTLQQEWKETRDKYTEALKNND